jgi:hypothetical protein
MIIISRSSKSFSPVEAEKVKNQIKNEDLDEDVDREGLVTSGNLFRAKTVRIKGLVLVQKKKL